MPSHVNKIIQQFWLANFSYMKIEQSPTFGNDAKL